LIFLPEDLNTLGSGRLSIVGSDADDLMWLGSCSAAAACSLHRSTVENVKRRAPQLEGTLVKEGKQ
jgi:hypothetical protein